MHGETLDSAADRGPVKPGAIPIGSLVVCLICIAVAVVFYFFVPASGWGEISTAKHVYVALRTGWFSCRSACFLAAGRPVVVQDTGFTAMLPTGRGLLAFTSADEAAEAIARVERDYAAHAAAARHVAQEHFADREGGKHAEREVPDAIVVVARQTEDLLRPVAERCPGVGVKASVDEDHEMHEDTGVDQM